MKTQTEQLEAGRLIRTISGKYFDVFDPDPALIDIADIAHALSYQCRFGGHLPEFYTVAQHSFHVAQLCYPGNELAGLLHDASEAYLLDLPRPIKREIPKYKEIENNLMRVIATKFGFEFPFCQDVKDSDQEMLEIEWKLFILKTPVVRFPVHHPKQAREIFLNEFKRLTK